MSQYNCCVPGCFVKKDSGIPLHRFPNPETNLEKFGIWVSNVGGEVLNLDMSYIYVNRRVCRNHFEDIYKYPKNRLSKLATPTLGLRGGQTHQDRVAGLDIAESPVPTFSDTLNMNHPIIEMQPSGSGGQTHQDRVAGLDIAESPVPTFSDTLNMNHPIIEMQPSGSDTQKSYGVRRQPKKVKKMAGIKEIEFTKYKTALKELKKCELQKAELKKKYFDMKKHIKATALQIVTKHMSLTAKMFCKMQVSQSRKKRPGRRFTLDEKILALTLYKPSPKAYRLLSKLCITPSRRTLQTMLSKINLKAGVNNIIFENLKNRVMKMPESHKYCSLLFDEMAIAPGISYNKQNDRLIGFVDDGSAVEKEFCDHALVFMVRGIFKKYKQPIAYYFCSGSTKTFHLKKQIEAIVSKLQETGLKVVATVCDQGTSNVAAINSLIKETRQKYLRNNQSYPDGIFEICENSVFPIYDPPHLIKGIRNNLISKNLEYEVNGHRKKAKWSHIVALYNKMPGYQGVNLVPKLTSHHVLPELIPKMRVKHCTQVFSKSVGAAMGYMAESGALDKECTDTADLLMFFDDLFDSVNGSYNAARNGKIYRTAVTATSRHHKLWNDSLKVLNTMKFVNANNQGVVPSLLSWVKTIQNFKSLVKYLHNKGITSLLLRNINQDPLENFFGAIRAHGCSNIMPVSSAFESAFKTLLINNISSPHSVGSNCEEDDTFCLQNLKKYLLMPESNVSTECEYEIHSDHLCMALINTDELVNGLTPMQIQKSAAIGYCSGWVALQAKKNVFKGCMTCHNDLMSEHLQSFHQFIKKKEYDNKNWLCYPTRALFDFFANVENICVEILKTQCNRSKLLYYIRFIVNLNINTTFINCVEHKEELNTFLINKSTIFFVNNWCKEINNILCGKNIILDYNILCNDPMKEKASRHYSRNKGRKRKRPV